MSKATLEEVKGKKGIYRRSSSLVVSDKYIKSAGETLDCHTRINYKYCKYKSPFIIGVGKDK